ncbi:hypothetical protein [Arthrobacter sp. ISL-30]|uniref:hypothetical protein n=1 Tax=Arthrobacter sp. ISL-30 TaxID=2819109 RepID=UPI001BE8D2D1|nr:hypothetical protein [Arthrobacter sp. ISL-30]MBT2513974.1 hypothetical protein [Arthrobacter sp. ISL-30]
MIGIPVRLKTAVSLVLLGLLTLLAGIGQLTFWAPAETVTATAPADTKAAPLTVIDQKLRTLNGEPVKISVKGEGNFVLAAGRPDDVAAWVGKTAHNTVSGVSEDNKALQVGHSEGEATAPSPAASDLWVSVENASGELDYTWNPPADGEWSLLLASDGTKAAPASVSMTFPNNATTPLAVPLIVLGIIIILAGAALPFLASLLGKGRGPGSPGRSGTGSGTPEEFNPEVTSGVQTASGFAASKGASSKDGRVRRVPALAAALATVLVAGTAVAAQASKTPEPSPTNNSSESPAPADAPVVLDSQLKRILEQVSSAVAAGDAAKDATKLEPRVDRMELQVRTQNYKIRSQVGSYEARMPVRASKLLTSVVSSQRSWPRSVIAVTEGEGNVVPQVLTLVQAAPRENYKLTSTAPLQPGTSFPAIPRGGTSTVAADDKAELQYSGSEALNGLADRLTNADSAFKDKLAESTSSPYIAGTLAYQADTVEKGVNGNFTFTHKVIPEATVVFRTSDGGALVVGRLDFALDGSPKAEGDKLLLNDESAVFAGGKETGTGMVMNFAESVAVYIPPAESKEPMKLVAATRGLVGASFK